MKKELIVKNLSFKFAHDAPYFFKDLSVSFESGKIHCIKGKNGSGKSTLFRILQEKLSHGEYFDAEITLENKTFKAFRKLVKQVQQNVNFMLADAFTVKENLQCSRFPKFPGLKKLPTIDQYANLLEKFEIHLDQDVGSLSGGQRQIVAVTMVLQKPTRVLLLDEPTAALDPKNTNMLMKYLEDIAHTQNLIVLIISHDDELIQRFAKDKVYLMHVEPDGTRNLKK